ncbi:hypothetical protein [Bradyrhizobium mercantei]|uniref:hypothetical protein n=1 Tax=Bradyrhizobium mercantei TaxID=1904807 RepID=UPI001177428F|nr:hypothetical protein [Bradyrhizobium mercantei]
MIKVLKVVAHAVWAIFTIGLGTLIGTSYGWVHHGWLGAIVLGTIGFGVGALFAAFPETALELLG